MCPLRTTVQIDIFCFLFGIEVHNHLSGVGRRRGSRIDLLVYPAVENQHFQQGSGIFHLLQS